MAVVHKYYLQNSIMAKAAPRKTDVLKDITLTLHTLMPGLKKRITSSSCDDFIKDIAKVLYPTTGRSIGIATAKELAMLPIYLGSGERLLERDGQDEQDEQDGQDGHVETFHDIFYKGLLFSVSLGPYHERLHYDITDNSGLIHISIDVDIRFLHTLQVLKIGLNDGDDSCDLDIPATVTQIVRDVMDL